MLAEVLTLPHPAGRAKSKHKPALNSKAVCITEDEVLEELKRKEREKAELDKEKEAKKLARIQKRDEKQLLTEQRKIENQTQKRKEDRKTCSVRNVNKEKVSQASMQMVEEFAKLQLSSASEAESDNAICPKCGAA